MSREREFFSFCYTFLKLLRRNRRINKFISKSFLLFISDGLLAGRPAGQPSRVGPGHEKPARAGLLTVGPQGRKKIQNFEIKCIETQNVCLKVIINNKFYVFFMYDYKNKNRARSWSQAKILENVKVVVSH